MRNATIEFRKRSQGFAWSSTAVLVAAVAAIFAAPLVRAQTSKRAVTVDDLVAMHRLSDPQISPDGKWVAYSVATPDVPANRMGKTIWLVGIDGRAPRQLIAAGERPRWSPDGSKIAFLSTANGASQIAWITLDAPSEAHPLTSLPAGVDNELWSPDGNFIAFVSNVYPDCANQGCDAQRDAEKANSKIHPRVYDRLMFRHWNTWWDGKRSHLFVIPAAGGAAKDLTPGADYDVPPFTLGSPEAIAFSPDSREICFTANSDREQAISTNDDLFTVAADGSSAPAAITTNPAADWGPVYSPDGKYIAYVAQTKPGYESDRWRLMLYSRADRKHINLTEKLDRSIGNFLWAPDSRDIYFQSGEHAEIPIFRNCCRPISRRIDTGRENNLERRRLSGFPTERRRQDAGVHTQHPGHARRTFCLRRERWQRSRDRAAQRATSFSARSCARRALLVCRRWWHPGGRPAGASAEFR